VTPFPPRAPPAARAPLQDDGRKPLPRYEQGAALLGTQIFMLGGHYGAAGGRGRGRGLGVGLGLRLGPRLGLLPCVKAPAVHVPAAPGLAPPRLSPRAPCRAPAPGGRYLEDLWVYDLSSLQWSQAQARAAPGQEAAPPPAAPPPPVKGKAKGEEGAPLLGGAVLPPSAGHSVTTWGERLLVLGGHTKVRGALARPRTRAR
jgi:hypothetical protein